jgi:hypothetical protein
MDEQRKYAIQEARFYRNAPRAEIIRITKPKHAAHPAAAQNARGRKPRGDHVEVISAATDDIAPIATIHTKILVAVIWSTYPTRSQI